MEDYKIAKDAKLDNIKVVAKKYGILEENLILYGEYKAKIDYKKYEDINRKAKLILVTATTPTPAGEGKTTVSVGLSDALNKINKKSVLALREPSLGPVFGLKGGACGGGYAQLAPMSDINLHFTGDFSAITAANNLISAHIDNNFWFGNDLNLDPEEIYWLRCMDANDRALKDIVISNNRYTRKERFEITPASEIMAIFCLSKSIEDLKQRIKRIVIGLTYDKKFVTVADLNILDSVVALLLDSFKPNIVQTLENNLAVVHGGPFANIAHGCNSINATNLALKLGDYCVTEAGFASDLGAEKFFNIKTREANLDVDCCVIVTTIKSLKANGGVELDNLTKENKKALKEGIKNLEQHCRIVKSFSKNFVVTLNLFKTDTEEEIQILKSWAQENKIEFAVNNVWGEGSNGGIELANKVVKLCEQKNEVNYTYDLNEKVYTKIEKICKNVYGAASVNFSSEVLDKLERLKKQDYYVVMAKTHMSLSDNKDLKNAPENFVVTIKRIEVKEGSNFIVCYTSDIITMPGLPKISNATKIKVVNEEIEGLF